MGKALTGIIEVVVGVVLEFVPGLQAIGTALIIAGVSTLASSLLAPKARPPEQASSAIKSPIPARIRAFGTSRLYGASLIFETAPDSTTVDVWAFAEGPADAVIAYYLNDDVVTLIGNVVQPPGDKRYQGAHVKVGVNLGQPTETAFSAVIAKLPGIWTSNHRGDGIVTGYMLKLQEKEKYFLETYPQGDAVTLSIVARWTKVFDPRDGSQDPYDSSTWKWSENAVLALIWYLMVERGFDWEKRFLPEVARLTAAINDADRNQALSVGGTEKRYRTAVAYKATDAPSSVIAALLVCFDGWYCINELGHVILYSGVYQEPAVSIGPDQIVAFNHRAGVADEDVVNSVSVTYVSSQHDYTTVEAQAWRDEDDIAARGEENTAALEAQIPSFTQGRRLAKRKLSRTNAADRGTVTTTFSGRSVLGERYINLLIEEAGAVFFDGVAEIVNSPERDSITGGVTFDWVAADPNIDAWNPETEDGEGATVGDRVAKEPLNVPTITSVAAVFADSTDTGTGVRLQINASGDDLAATTWYLRWRKDSSSVWNEQAFPDLDPGPDVELLSGFVPVSSDIEVEVEYRTADGRLSSWSTPATTVDTRTNIAAPDAATAITLVGWTGTLRLTTERIPRASSYRWRFFDPGDLVTPLRTITTTVAEVGYTSGQASIDGPRRDYVVDVAGVNGAGAGTPVATSTLTLPAPTAVTGLSATGGTGEAEIDFTNSSDPSVVGYVVSTSTASSFDPATQGTARLFAGKPAYLQNWAAGTYYVKVAPFDAWTSIPGLLNFTSETSFTTTGTAGGGGGGGGDGGGGYCVTIDTLILMADGTEKPAGDLVVGDMLRTQHETTFEWGDYPVEAITFKRRRVLAVDIGARRMRATKDHAVWLAGDWVRFDAIGSPVGLAMVALITVADAHTYVSNRVLSHNVMFKDVPPL